MSARSMLGMDQHPDIMELRAKYERAAATPVAQFAAGAVTVAVGAAAMSIAAMSRR